MRGCLNVDPDKPMRALFCPTVEGVAELFTAISGSDATAEELARTELTRGNLMDAPRPKVQRTDD